MDPRVADKLDVKPVHCDIALLVKELDAIREGPATGEDEVAQLAEVSDRITELKKITGHRRIYGEYRGTIPFPTIESG